MARDLELSEEELAHALIDCAHRGLLSDSWNAALQNALSDYSNQQLWLMVRRDRSLFQLFEAIGFDWPCS